MQSCRWTPNNGISELTAGKWLETELLKDKQGIKLPSLQHKHAKYDDEMILQTDSIKKAESQWSEFNTVESLHTGYREDQKGSKNDSFKCLL